MNTFSADIHGYVASISFSNDDITNVYKCTVYISYLPKQKDLHFKLAFIVNNGLLYIEMFIKVLKIAVANFFECF